MLRTRFEGALIKATAEVGPARRVGSRGEQRGHRGGGPRGKRVTQNGASGLRTA